MSAYNKDKSSVRLKWKGPFPFKDFLLNPKYNDEFSCPGVYMWVIEHDRRKCIQYIGKSQSVFHRILDEFFLQIGCKYSIPKEFRSCRKDWHCNFNDKKIFDILLHKEKLLNLIGESFDYIMRNKLYIACQENEGNKFIGMVERNLLWQLQPCRTKWGTMSKPKNVLSFIHVGAFNNDEIEKMAKDPIKEKYRKSFIKESRTV